MLQRYRYPLILAVLAAALLPFYEGCQDSAGPAPVKPKPDPAPAPDRPSPCPPNRPCPRDQVDVQQLSREAAATVRTDMLTPSGKPMQLEFPASRHRKNVGGSDGAGLCVFCSMAHSGDWSQEPVFLAIFDWMRSHPGGGYPEKVDRMVKSCSTEKRLPLPRYLQIEGADIHLLKVATENGFMPGVTYAYSPSGRYNGARIAHMVTLVHLDLEWAGIVDNNYPGSVEWMPIAEFQKVYTGGRSGWSVILLHDGPPPAPHNAR